MKYIQYNAPVILSLFFCSFVCLLISFLTKGVSNNKLFSTYKSSLLNPFTYIRMFTHIIGHQNWSHFMNNYIYILILGPLLEEKYGSVQLLIMICITAFVTALLNMIFGKYRLLGASGIVFMFIALSSLVNVVDGTIPLTLILVIVFYIINEILSLVFKRDNVSHLTHIIGAMCGFIYGFYIL